MYLPDNTIGALAELLRHSISLIDDKVLVEDLEDLSSLQIRHGVRVSEAGAVGLVCI